MSDHPHQGGERYTIEVEALPSDVPPHVRLRQWLKAALRVSDTTPKLSPLPPAPGRRRGRRGGMTIPRQRA
jgi:hypothetical protein